MTLKSLRQSNNLSQYKLSILTGISRYKISMVECGYSKLSPKQTEKVNRVIESYIKNKQTAEVENV